MSGREDPSTGSGQAPSTGPSTSSGRSSGEAVARAIAYFESCDDVDLLRKALAEVAPRARRLVVRYLGHGGEDAVPPPADVPHMPIAASKDDALKILAATNDFALLQAMTRAMGRRVEELQEI